MSFAIIVHSISKKATRYCYALKDETSSRTQQYCKFLCRLTSLFCNFLACIVMTSCLLFCSFIWHTLPIYLNQAFFSVDAQHACLSFNELSMCRQTKKQMQLSLILSQFSYFASMSNLYEKLDVINIDYFYL